MTRALAVALLALAGSASLVHATHEIRIVESSEDNAALIYWRLFDMYDADLLNEAWTAVNDDESRLEPGTDLAKRLSQQQGVVQLALKASSMEECDFEIDYADGFETILPHLGKMRNVARLLGADARRLELAGDLLGAAERTAALYRVAGHLSEDEVLIGSLVAIAIANVANEQAERLGGLDLDRADRLAILGAIDALDAADPYGVLDAIELEQRIVRTWVVETYAGEDAAAEFYRMMVPLAGDETDDETLADFEAMDEATFHAAVEQTAATIAELFPNAAYAQTR